MSQIDRQITDRINNFVEELSALVRRAAVDAVSDALAGSGPGMSRTLPDATAIKAATALRARREAAAPPPSPRKPGAKRTPESIVALTEQLYAFIASNPGLRIEPIGRALNTPTKDLTLPIKKLLKHGRITSKGHRRSTTYTAAAGGAARKATATAAAKPAKRKRAAGKKRRPAAKKATRTRKKKA